MGLTNPFAISPVTQQLILEKLGNRVQASGEFRGDFWIRIQSDHYLATIDLLKSEADFQFTEFVDLCGVDYLPKSPRFEIITHLYSPSKKFRIRVKCEVSDATLTIPSLTSRWNAANWQEREAYDMYGILFDGHPKLERILNAPNMKGFPQRKDFPLKGTREEVED